MKKCQAIFFAVLLSAVFFPSAASAAGPWEEIVSIKSGDVYGRIDLHKRSFKKKLIKGEKVLNFKLKYRANEGKGEVELEKEHEVFCSTRDAFVTSTTLIKDETKTLPRGYRDVQRTQLTGKEYDEFGDVMNLLCKR